MEAKSVVTVLKLIAVGTAFGGFIGWVFHYVSGDISVFVLCASVGFLVGLVVGLIHRNDP